MAITHRLYRAARLGSGVFPDRYRSALSRYIIEDGTGATYEDWIKDPIEAATAFYSLASAESTVHALCESDPDITVLSPEFATLEALQAWLDGSISGEFSPTARTTIETDKIPIDDITTSNTRREFWRRLGIYHRVSNYMSGQGDGTALEFLKANLDSTVQQLPIAVRTRIRNWMTERGLDTTWITNSTTVRAVLKFLLVNVNITPNRFTRLAF